MYQVPAGCKLVCCISLPEAAEGSVTDRLFFKAGGMECILEAQVEFTFLTDFIICEMRGKRLIIRRMVL